MPGFPVVFAPARIVRRVIKRHRAVGGLGLQVPHAESYRIPRAELDRIVPNLASDGETVILLPDTEAADLRWLWRRHFHERIHIELESRLTPARLREHVHRIGTVEFDETRRILRHDRLLLPPYDEREVYSEFAARYLELRHFDAEALDRFFPAVGRRREEIEALLAEDVEAAQLLQSTRPAGFQDAPQLPTAVTRIVPAVSLAPDPEHAQEERSRGNWVGAAVRSGEDSDLAALSGRLETTTGETGWADALRPVLIASGGSPSSPEARLLYDLQTACLEAEATPHRVDVVEWALSLGRRAIRRPLEAIREVAALERFRRAAKRLRSVRLSRPARLPLSTLLARTQHAFDARIRSRLRPVLDSAIQASGLGLATTVERVAGRKIAEELADRVIERGFFTFSELRDAVARNQAKLHDLSGPKEFILGDPLLRLDKSLAVPLEGVYRRGEVYLRWLQRFSSLAFGTGVGRFLTRYAVLPFGGAFVVLEGLQHVVGPLFHVHLLTPISFASLGIVLLLLLHVATFRRGVVAGLRGARFAVRSGFAPIRYLWKTRPVRWSLRYLLGPAVLAAPFVLLRPRWIAAAVFVVFDILLNTPLGRGIVERVEDWLVRSWHLVGRAFLPGLLRWMIDFFHGAVDLLERALYRIDEFLRFRPGESAVSIVLKGAVGLVWFVVSYLARIYLNLLIEPQVNPVKHFPVVTVSHKIILPMTLTITEIVRTPLMPLGPVIANALAVSTVFLLPGVFGFLVWELKENWRLYAANRPKTLKPVVVGSHGETIPRLLRPGFHSGTIPKLFAKLRRAKRAERRAAEKMEAQLHHVEEAVRRFVERDAIALAGGEVEAVRLSPCRILVKLQGIELSFEERSGRLIARSVGDGLDAAIPGLWRMAGADLSTADIEARLGTSRYDVIDEGFVVWRDETESVVPLDPELLLRQRPLAWADWVRTWERGAARSP